MMIQNMSTVLSIVTGVVLLCCGQVGAQSAEQTLEQLVGAARDDNNEAYLRARIQALALPDEQFARLLKDLSEIDTWQAMAMGDGLKLRREQPEVAKDFDDRMREIVTNASLDRKGEPYYTMSAKFRSDLVRGLEDTAEHDILRFEALLAWKCRHERRGKIDALRRDLLVMHTQDATTMKRRILMLKDRPQWLDLARLTRSVDSLSRRPGLIDPHLLEIVEQYKMLRREPGPDSLLAARSLIHAVGQASPEMRQPALQEIERFERATMAKVGLEPWSDDYQTLSRQELAEREALERMREALRKAPDDAAIQERIAVQEEVVEKTRLRMYAGRLWSSLVQVMNESEAKENANGQANQNGNGN